jgi:hypothetical protein
MSKVPRQPVPQGANRRTAGDEGRAEEDDADRDRVLHRTGSCAGWFDCQTGWSPTHGVRRVVTIWSHAAEPDRKPQGRIPSASRTVVCARERVPVAQRTEQPPSKRKVAGSNPAGGANFDDWLVRQTKPSPVEVPAARDAATSSILRPRGWRRVPIGAQRMDRPGRRELQHG